MHLDEVEVKGHAGRYPKRNKLLGYLDSISTPYGAEWVCGCPAGYGTSFLNDYVSGYTHHPGNESYQPIKRSKPIKGKSYVIVKYTGGQYPRDWLVDIQTITYNGPKYTEEELLKMNGICKTLGYYPKREFITPTADEMSLGLDDNRNTLLWIPKTETDENGELEVEFYTSDISSIFYIDCVSYQPNGNSYGNGHISFRVN